jgi:hypothetical protein
MKNKVMWDRILLISMTFSMIEDSTDFLHGNLDEEMYMDVPFGLNVKPN